MIMSLGLHVQLSSVECTNEFLRLLLNPENKLPPDHRWLSILFLNFVDDQNGKYDTCVQKYSCTKYIEITTGSYMQI